MERHRAFICWSALIGAARYRKASRRSSGRLQTPGMLFRARSKMIIPEDKRAIQATLSQIMMYPVAEITGDMLAHDWINVPPGTGDGARR